MAKVKCPNCGKGEMRVESIQKFETKLRGIPFVVKDAKIAQCDTCGEQVYDAKEIKRWEEVLKKKLQAQDLLITPYEVKKLREAMGLSVADFASIFGVTRQTVYGWESEKTSGVQLGPASLLLGLLVEEQNRSLTGICDFLFASARNRGQEIISSQRKTEIARHPLDIVEGEESALCSMIRYRDPGSPTFCVPEKSVA
jgi:putative zinc finger/helix-turn-helix YgiT family protein